MERHVGLLIVFAGLAIAIVGLLVMAGAFGWFGRLPGDIRVERGTTRVFVPITSMIVVSIVLTALLNLGRFLR